MAKRLSANGGNDHECKRERAPLPKQTCAEDAENYEITKKCAAESEDDSTNSANKKREKVGGGARRRHYEADDDESKNYYRAPTSGRCKRKSYAQSSDSCATDDSETTVTTSSCDSRQSQPESNSRQSSNEDLDVPKTDLKYKRIAGGAKKSIKHANSRLQAPTDNAQRMKKRENVRAQTVRTENADANTNNGTTKEMVRFMNKLLISLGNVENSFSAAVNSVSANHQRAQKILNNKSSVNYADTADYVLGNYARFGATNSPQQHAHETQTFTPKTKSPYPLEDVNNSRDERVLGYVPQLAAARPPLKMHVMPPTVHFNTQPTFTPESPNYISTHNPQFHAFTPTPTAATPTGPLPQLPRISAAQQAALPAIQTLNALPRNQTNISPTNQHRLESAEYQPNHNGLTIFANGDSKTGNEHAYLTTNPALNQNSSFPAGSPNRPYNNRTQFEVESVAVEKDMALPGNIQTYYNKIDYNGGIMEPQLEGNYREMHENETSQENSLNRGSMSMANRGSLSNVEYTTNRGRVSDGGSGISNGKNETNSGRLSDRGSGISNRESKAKRGTISDRGNGISNGGRGSVKNEKNKAYSTSRQSDFAEANAEYSNANEGRRKTHNERKSRLSRTSALEEMFAEINAANEMRRKTTSNGKKYSMAQEMELEESQSVEESSCSCNSDYIRKCLRRKQAKKHNKYDDKQRTHNKNRKSHYKDASSESESDEAYPRSSFHGKRATQRYKYYADSASSDAVSYSLSRTSCKELKRCCSRIVAICRMARDTAGTQTEQYWGDSASRLGKLNNLDDGVPKAIVDGLATANPKVVEQIMKMLRKRRKCKVCACGVVGENGAPVVKDDMIVLKFEGNEPMLPPVICIDERSRSSCSCGTKLTETESEIIREIIRKKRLLEKSQRISALMNSGKYSSCDGLSICTCVNEQDEMEFVEGLLRRSRSERERPRDSTQTENINSNDCDCTTRKAKELAAEIMKELIQGHMQKMFVDKIENKTRHDAERVSSKSVDTIISLSNDPFAAENSCACGTSSPEAMLAKQRAYEARESTKSRASNCTCNADESTMGLRNHKRSTYRAGDCACDNDGRPMVSRISERSKPLVGECTCHGDERLSMRRRSDSIAPQAGECTCNGHERASMTRKSEGIVLRAGECTCAGHKSASVARKSERIVLRAGECTCSGHETASMARKSKGIVSRAGECTCVAHEAPIITRRSHRITPRAGECTCYPDESTTELAMSERIKTAVTECTSNSDDSITVIRISGRPKSTAGDCTCNANGNPLMAHQGKATQRETVETSNIPRYSKLHNQSASAEPTKRNTERDKETITTEYQTVLEESLVQERQANAFPRIAVGESERESELLTRASARRSYYPTQQRKDAYTRITQPPRNGSSKELMREPKDWENKSNVFPKNLESEQAARTSNRQSEYQGEHRMTTRDSTTDFSLGESEIKEADRKSNVHSKSTPRESERTSSVFEHASDRRSEYQAQPRLTGSKNIIIEPQRSSNRTSKAFAYMGEDKTAELETPRNYSIRDSSFTDKERQRSTLETETEESTPIELSTMDKGQRKLTKYQLIIPSETDSSRLEESAGALKKSIINETPMVTDYTQMPCRTDCGCRETNTEMYIRPKKNEERAVGEYEEKSLQSTGPSNYGANKCRIDCGCKIVSTDLHTRSKEDEQEDIREYEERIMARANSTRTPRPKNYTATMYNPESDFENAFREKKAPPYEEAVAVVSNSGQQKDRPNLRSEDNGMSRAKNEHGSMQKFIIDIKACKQASASCTLTAYQKTNKNTECEISRSIARVDAENTDSDLRMKQRAALCAELTMNELLPQHSLRTLLTKLSSPQGKLYAKNEFPQKEKFNPTIFRAQTLQTKDNTFKSAAEDLMQIQFVDRRRELKLALSAPSIITRRQDSAANDPEGTQNNFCKKSLMPLPIGSRRPATPSMLLMQSTSAEKRTNSRPFITQTSNSNHQITRLCSTQTKTGTETKQETQPSTKSTYNREINHALLTTERSARSASDMQLSYGTGYSSVLPRLASGRHKEIQTNSSMFSGAGIRQQSRENINQKWKNSQTEPTTPKMVNIPSAAKQQHYSSSGLSSVSSESRKSAAPQREYKPCNGHCKAFYKRTGKHRNLRNPFSGYAACNEPPPLLKTATIVATTKKHRESDRGRNVSDGEQTNSDVECITVEYASSDAAFQDSYAQYQAELQRQQELWRIDNVREAIKVEEQEAERAKTQLHTTLRGELLERAIHYPTRVWNEERKQLNLQRNGATIFGPL